MKIKLVSDIHGPKPCVHYCEYINDKIFIVKKTFYGDTWKDLVMYFLSEGVYKEVVREGIPYAEF